MKVKIKSWDAVALWKWKLQHDDVSKDSKVYFVTHNLAQSASLPVAARMSLKNTEYPRPSNEDLPVFQIVDLGEQDEDEDVCGICRNLFDGCCPDCSAPGDGCPISFGKCSHIFHTHCIKKWLLKQEASGGSGTCPMDRRVWEYQSF